MSLRSKLGLLAATFLFSMCLGSVGMFVSSTSAATCLRPNEIPITTSEDREKATAAGVPTNYPCWIPGQPYTGANVGEAKVFLRSNLCKQDGDSYGGAGPDQTIQQLNPEFATCAAQFIKFAQQNNIPVCIKEGYRTPEKQNEYVRRGAFACKQGAQCEHPQGIAIDVNTSSRANYAWLHQNACQFGLDFYLRFRDQYHFVPLSHSIQRGKSSCGTQKVMSCQTAGFAPQNMGYGYIPPASPTSNFANAIRQALGISTPQPAPTQPAVPSQPVSSSQSPLQAFEPTSAGGVSTQIDMTGRTTHATSVADLLEELAFGQQPTSTQTSTGTTVPLVISGSQAVGIVSTQPVAGGQNLPPGVSGISDQTFISGDLSWQGGGVQPMQPLTGWDAIVATIKATLNRMLQLLTPFGARDTIYYNEHGEFEVLE